MANVATLRSSSQLSVQCAHEVKIMCLRMKHSHMWGRMQEIEPNDS
jgi:hypothetical protein